MSESVAGTEMWVDTEREPEVTTEDLVDRASALVPVLKERARQTEALRQIPTESIDDLKSAGFFRIATPKRFGGNGQEFNAGFEVSMELGRGCGSTAWCYSVWASHNWMVGQWPLPAQEEYFADGPDVLCSSSFAPQGRLQPVDGGYRLSGRWEFSSGSNAATWALLAAMAPDGPVFVILPRSDYEVVDTWTASGLKGTGSNDIVVSDVFVPARRVAPFGTGGDDAVGWRVHQRPSYRVPTFSILPWTLGAPLVSMAQGAIDDFVGRLRRRHGARSGESVAIQLRVAESAAYVDAARRTLRQHAKDVVVRGSRGEVVAPEELIMLRRDFCFVAKLAVQAVNILFDASGGHAVLDSDPMQRHHRDVHAGAHHVMLGWDTAAEGYGRLVFGLPPIPRAY
jgi:alkylation response protein AidB-like acyl-CoA dehydrogenase